jgi:EmrB/QacA subfamily drug resistance transporter
MESVVPASAQAGPAVAHAALELPRRARFEVLGAILLGLFLTALDQTIVGTALPRIVTDLRGNDLYTWVVTIYLLTSTITIPVYGKLSDLYGRKPMLLIGITLFLAGSALSGLSQEMWQLIAFRGVQGLGAGAVFPVALAVIGDLFTPAERGKYQGLFGAVFGLSALIGPALGGFLTDAVSWHWVFYVNLPIGAVALFVIWRVLPTFRRPDASRNIDYAGVIVFTLGIVPILIGLTNKQTGEWVDPSVGGLIAVGLAITALFVWIESRAAEPIVPLGLFRIRAYTFSVMATFLAAFGFLTTIVFLPRFFQFVRGTSATESGYQLMALLVGMIGSSMLSGYLVSRTGRYKALLVGGIAVSAVGLALLSNLHANTELPVLWAWMFITGVGIGPTLAVFTIVVQNAVPIDRLGVATGNLTFFRQVGGTVGLAIAGTVFGDTLRDQVPVQLTSAGVPAQLVQQFAGHQGFRSDEFTGIGNLGQQILASVPEQYRTLVEPVIPNMVTGIHEAFAIAVAATFIVGIAAGVMAVAAALFIPELPLRRTLGRAPAVDRTPGVDRASEPVPGSRPYRRADVQVELTD